MYYTGIGSRETPIDIQNKMTALAKILSKHTFILRSGGAAGADSAFESGATYKHIYLPWNGFNNRYADGKQYIVPDLNIEMVETYHPDPTRLSNAAIKLMSRNTYQVLGDDLNTPSKFLVCWTYNGKLSGGTAQAMRIAQDYCIPIYNLYNTNAVDNLLSDWT